MDVEGTKYLTMFLLGIVPLILGFLPLKVGKQFYNNDKPWKRTFTSVLLCYGGGLLLATASIHILPEVRETLEKADYVWLKDRPFGEIFTAIGFFIIYFIEEFVHYFLDSSIHHHHSASVQVHKSFTVHTNACEAGMTDFENCSSPTAEECRKPRRVRAISYPGGFSQTFQPTLGNELKKPGLSVAIAERSNSSESSGRSSDTDVESCCDDVDVGPDNSPKSALRNFLTIVALSLHCVFEGLAIGLEDDQDSVWILFAAVATHKFVISFCIALELYHARTPIALYSAYIIIFAIVTPIGMGIGIGISQLEASAAYWVTVGSLQAIAGGTIIYIAVFEILERERSKNVSGLVQLFFIVVGYATIFMVQIVAPEPEE